MAKPSRQMALILQRLAALEEAVSALVEKLGDPKPAPKKTAAKKPPAKSGS